MAYALGVKDGHKAHMKGGHKARPYVIKIFFHLHNILTSGEYNIPHENPISKYNLLIYKKFT